MSLLKIETGIDQTTLTFYNNGIFIEKDNNDEHWNIKYSNIYKVEYHYYNLNANFVHDLNNNTITIYLNGNEKPLCLYFHRNNRKEYDTTQQILTDKMKLQLC